MNVLAIGAHFDDIELGCGGTIIRHVNNGDNVIMYVITDSEYTNYDNTILRSKKIAYEEGINAAKKLGVDILICEKLKTKKVDYGIYLIEKMNKVIDKYNIDIIYTHWTHDVHQDHSAVGRATLNAGRHVQRILSYRSNWYATDAFFNGNFYVDISPYIEKKLEAIRAHKSQYNKFGEKWIDFVRQKNRNNGIEMEVEYAESFQIIKYII
jgi:LmbE family N-acetylglucosaminyl deacetylase